jgi:hypothetical protein
MTLQARVSDADAARLLLDGRFIDFASPPATVAAGHHDLVLVDTDPSSGRASRRRLSFDIPSR